MLTHLFPRHSQSTPNRKRWADAQQLPIAAVEKLEDRRMKAGNVTVEVDDGDLEIRGENNTEQGIAIEATNVAGQFRVIGLDTTVNGADEILVTGVTNDVDIDMRSGGKLVILTEGDQAALFINGDLEIDTRGNSADVIILDTVNVEGRTTVRTRGGDDALIDTGSTHQERTLFNLGGGNDGVLTNLDASFEEDLDIRTGGGEDYVMVAATEVMDELDIRTGGGQDIIGVYSSQAFEANINGNGRNDALEDFDNSFVEFDFNSIEDEYNGGFAQMNAEARANNDTYDDAFLTFVFFGLAG